MDRLRDRKLYTLLKMGYFILLVQALTKDTKLYLSISSRKWPHAFDRSDAT